MKKKNKIKKGWKFDPTKVKHVPEDTQDGSTITCAHYTVMGDHPEDRIYRDREYIRRLQGHIDCIFDLLKYDLHLNEKGEEWLFDFVYNEDRNIEFEDFLAKYNVKYCDLVK